MEIIIGAKTAIPIYFSSIAGILISLWNLKKIQNASKNIEEQIEMSTSSLSNKEKIIEDSEEKNTFIKEKSNLNQSSNEFLPKNELKFFKELGFYFINENRYFFLIFFIFSPLIFAISYFWLHWTFGICFIIGYLEFLLTFWLTRKIFIKMMLRMNLRNDNIELKNHNWNIFTKFIIAALLLLNLSTVIFSVFTILNVFNYFFNDINQDLVHSQTPKTPHFKSKYTQFQIFVICYAFYLVGKNLLLLFNNIWYSYHINRNTLRYLKIYENHENKLINQSYGFYYNMMSHIHRHNILLTEVIVLSTICLSEYKTSITVFFIYLAAVLLFLLILISVIITLSYNFKHLREFMKMISVVDGAFSYVFAICFIFLFYRFFIIQDVLVIDRKGFSMESSFSYVYLIMFLVMVLTKTHRWIFVSSYHVKKNKKFMREEMYGFSMNLKLFLKIGYNGVFLYFIFLFFGFLGVIFVFFFLNFQNIFYRMKKLVLTFNMYIKTILLFCGVCRVHHINFNKLLNITDKSYIFNFFLLLFCIPLYHLADIKNKSKDFFGINGSFNNFLSKLLIITVSYVISTFFLLFYSRILCIGYKKFIKINKMNSTQKQRIMNLIKERHFFFIISGLIYLSYIYLFYYYFSHSDILCAIIGMAIKIFQLIYKNKIRIKKYWESPYQKDYNVENFMAINKALSQSPRYLQSLCELSFANILVEVAKIMLITQFVLHFIKKDNKTIG